MASHAANIARHHADRAGSAAEALAEYEAAVPGFAQDHLDRAVCDELRRMQHLEAVAALEAARQATVQKASLYMTGQVAA